MTKLFKESQNSFQDEKRPSRPTEVSTSEMFDSVNELILFYRRVKIKDISEQLGISVGIAQLCMVTLPFLRSVVQWIPRMDSPEYKQKRV